jgi:hypothetical protein
MSLQLFILEKNADLNPLQRFESSKSGLARNLHFFFLHKHLMVYCGRSVEYTLKSTGCQGETGTMVSKLIFFSVKS